MEAFDEAFPNGSATLQQIVEHQLCEPKWLGWLAVNASFVTEDIAMELIQRSDDPGHYCGEAAVRADWVTDETGPGMISKSSEPRHFAERAILLAYWMTPKIKAELIAKYGD
jgi:hypothetical protein